MFKVKTAAGFYEEDKMNKAVTGLVNKKRD